MNSSNKTPTVVAMSGGVDSSVAALLLAKEEVPIIGVSMQVWDYRKNGGCSSKATCCSPDDFTDARKVAAKIDIPYYVFDFENTFRKEVIDNFSNTYARGETPNPCIDCNQKVKFKELRERARALNCEKVATGHYAQIEKTDRGFHLYRSVDLQKDQSYFLYGLSQKELGETVFPVGHLEKSQVREIAAEAGLSTASKPESQDICFISGSVKDFLVRIGTNTKPGEIKNSKGEVLAQHQGIHEFTVGQRRGLNIGGLDKPLYVVEICSSTNTVIVGERSELEKEGFLVAQMKWLSPEVLSFFEDGNDVKGKKFKALAQLRHRHSGVPVEVEILDEHSVKAKFIDDWSTVSPGQAAVFYTLDNKEVLCGGRILNEK